MSTKRVHYIYVGVSDFPFCGSRAASPSTSENREHVDCGNCLRLLARENTDSASDIEPRPVPVVPTATEMVTRESIPGTSSVVETWKVTPLDSSGHYDHTNAPALCDGCDKVRMVRSDDGRTLLCRDCRRTVRKNARKPRIVSPLSAETILYPRYKKPRRPRGTGETRKYRRQYMSARKHRDRAGNKHHHIHVAVGSAA